MRHVACLRAINVGGHRVTGDRLGGALPPGAAGGTVSGGTPFALTCPACGGLLTAREGDTHTVCPSCDSALRLGDAVRRFVLPSAVSIRSVTTMCGNKNVALISSICVRSELGFGN